MQKILTKRLFLWVALAAVLWLPAVPASGGAPTPVLTQHNDNARTGAYLDETILSASNVNSAQFGKLFTRPLDGQIYAQPLYVPGVATTPGGPRNVVYVATMHNSVYAFDAENPEASQPLWQVSLGPSAPVTYTLPNTTTIGHDFGGPDWNDVTGEIGILSTPVIDANSHTLYAVALNREPNPPACPCQYAYRLHALDLATGAEKFGGPVVISGTVPGAAEDGEDNQVTFNTRQQDQRAALLLQAGVVYMAFASFGDQTPYHGWVFGYSADSLQQVSAWNSSPNTGLSGIWQSGQGLAADVTGQIYLLTGNGPYDQAGGDFGDSFVKLDSQSVVSGLLPVAGSFTPYDQHELEIQDADLGSGGPLLIPGTRLLVGAGKIGKLYLLNQDDMGGYQEGPGHGDRVVQSFQAGPPLLYPLRGTPIFWNSPSGARLYQWGAGSGLQAYGLAITNAVSATIQTTPVATSTTQPLTGRSGGYLSLSANGSSAGTGIVWAVRAETKSGRSVPQSVLYAFNAEDVSQTLWNSDQVAARDAAGDFAKFNPPTIANGRVYLATFSNQLLAYGIMGRPHVLAHPLSQNGLTGQSAALAVIVSGQGALAYQWYEGTSGDSQQPVGTNAPTFTTPPLAGTTRYWVRATNGLGSVDSATAVITVSTSRYLPVIQH